MHLLHRSGGISKQRHSYTISILQVAVRIHSSCPQDKHSFRRRRYTARAVPTGAVWVGRPFAPQFSTKSKRVFFLYPKRFLLSHRLIYMNASLLTGSSCTYDSDCRAGQEYCIGRRCCPCKCLIIETFFHLTFQRSCSLEYFYFLFSLTFNHFCKHESTQVSTIQSQQTSTSNFHSFTHIIIIPCRLRARTPTTKRSKLHSSMSARRQSFLARASVQSFQHQRLLVSATNCPLTFLLTCSCANRSFPFCARACGGDPCYFRRFYRL